MRIGKDMIKQAEAQFLMDCALPPESAGTRQGYLIGKKPGMPEQDFMTDVSYGYLVRECMEKAAAGLDYGIASRSGDGLVFPCRFILREGLSSGG